MQATSHSEDAPSPALRVMITIVVMSASLMQVLDTTIANVALPHMQATLSATQDSISWVLTSYIVASAIATPVTGWLEGRIGRRALFLTAVIGFTLSSMACGLAPTLPAMVAARLFQGIFGAFISPLSQAIMLDTYPREKQPLAMTIWGMGIMIGPILGPVVGGYLTESFNWRWVFFINVPIGIAGALGGAALLKSGKVHGRPFDLLGFTLLALALASFQLVLDRGTQLDWLDSKEILFEIAVAAGAFWMFAVHSATARHPLIPPVLLTNRNLIVASIFLATASGITMAGSALIAPMLQRLMGYGVVDAGMTMMPRGIGMMAAMLLTGRLVAFIDGRVLIGGGLALAAVSQFMMAGFNLEMGSGPLILSAAMQGAGLGLMMLPLNLLAFATLAPALRTEGASLYSLLRNIGGSITIALTSALVARNLQVSHSDLSAHVTVVSMPYVTAGMLDRVGIQAPPIMEMLDGEINRQALMISYLDVYWLMAWAAVIVTPLVVLLSPARRGEKAQILAE
jgi:MFS transporter, DHA2 family, multidrug resistance protein